MSPDEVGAVRTFNRLVTERLGALHDDYLGRARPLGASRVLWEVWRGAQDVRRLRSRLGLDAGYVSRLLRSLESEGLVTVRPSSDDARVRTVELTPEGRREVAALDADSDALADSMLHPLTSRQRADLVTAMGTVVRLLTAGLVEVEVVDPRTDHAQHCLSQYFAELDERFDAGFDPSASISATADELTEPAGLLLVARHHGEPIGCGALKFHDDAPTELKRMWVSPSARGLGVGRRILDELERHATAHGASIVRLETNAALTEAIGLYRASGYREVAAFNDEPHADHWFEKRL
jgi:DNA-binding MarR family transcriptional regulator/GNAT superfamily N-acetyltransferase